ncbi:MAG: flavin reductase family protein, partial [Chloroflexi bacterium]|nr:flavin reductase family protein [Chloroflexota bacterium]
NDIAPLKVDPLIFTPDGYYHALGPRLGQAWSVGAALKKG